VALTAVPRAANAAIARFPDGSSLLGSEPT
jgi:hypothetical protein